MGYKWIKTRKTFSSGPSSWDFHLVDERFGEEDVECFAEEISNGYYWSEHFRGVNWEIDNVVPQML